jgi:hypothetical protein
MLNRVLHTKGSDHYKIVPLKQLPKFWNALAKQVNSDPIISVNRCSAINQISVEEQRVPMESSVGEWHSGKQPSFILGIIRNLYCLLVTVTG